MDLAVFFFFFASKQHPNHDGVNDCFDNISLSSSALLFVHRDGRLPLEVYENSKKRAEFSKTEYRNKRKLPLSARLTHSHQAPFADGLLRSPATNDTGMGCCPRYTPPAALGITVPMQLILPSWILWMTKLEWNWRRFITKADEAIGRTAPRQEFGPQSRPGIFERARERAPSVARGSHDARSR
jgi:hypothetical protein